MIRRSVIFISIVLSAGLLSACSHKPSATAQPAITTVQAAAATQRSFTHDVTGYGVVVGNPHHTRQLTVAHGGQVTAVTVSNGQSVKAGQPLFRIAAAPLTRQAFKQAHAALVLARQQLTRVTTLAAQHLATHAQVDAAHQAVRDAQASVQAQRELGGGSATRVIKAPAAGVITQLRVTRGQRLAANTVLAMFAPDAERIATIGLAPGAAAQVRPDMPATVQAAYGTAKPAHGKVTVVGHAVNPRTHLVPIEISLPSAWTSAVAIGAAVSARIATRRFRAWAVPRKALQSDVQGHYVFQIEHGKAKRVAVKVLAPDGSPVGISGSLDPKAPVITLGSYEVSAGQAVQAVKPTRAHAKETAAR